jgi:hypothetical protein
MSNEIDRIMHEDPLGLTKPDLKTLIAYHRSRRGVAENDEEPAKPKRKLDLQALGLVKPKPKFARRI